MNPYGFRKSGFLYIFFDFYLQRLSSKSLELLLENHSVQGDGFVARG